MIERLALCLLLAAASHAADDPGDVSQDYEGDRAPRKTVIPAYPEAARRERIEGEVRVCFEIDRDGRPRRIAVRTSTNRVFERPAIRAVRQSRYEPLPEGQKPSGVKTCRTFRFRLPPADHGDPARVSPQSSPSERLP